MTELVLVFVLGMLVAGSLWLLALPAFWRRAVRLTRARIENAMPLSPNEIAAELDMMRASHAVALVRARQIQDEAWVALGKAKSETGARLMIEADLLAKLAGVEDQRAALEAEITVLKADSALRDRVIAELKDAHDLARASITGLETQCEAIGAQRDSAVELAEKRQRALDEARVLADRAREALGEETRRSAELRQQLLERQHELRDLARRLEDGESRERLARIRGGEETYQSALADNAPRKAG